MLARFLGRREVAIPPMDASLPRHIAVQQEAIANLRKIIALVACDARDAIMWSRIVQGHLMTEHGGCDRCHLQLVLVNMKLSDILERLTGSPE